MIYNRPLGIDLYLMCSHEIKVKIWIPNLSVVIPAAHEIIESLP
jgi:hypothetical protein